MTFVLWSGGDFCFTLVLIYFVNVSAITFLACGMVVPFFFLCVCVLLVLNACAKAFVGVACNSACAKAYFGVAVLMLVLKAQFLFT